MLDDDDENDDDDDDEETTIRSTPKRFSAECITMKWSLAARSAFLCVLLVMSLQAVPFLASYRWYELLARSELVLSSWLSSDPQPEKCPGGDCRPSAADVKSRRAAGQAERSC